MSAGTVIVGASLAGIRTAYDLRQAGYADPITLIGEEPAKPYDRPPLSKGFLTGKDSTQSISLCADEEVQAHGITLVTGVAARSVDLGRRVVELEGGNAVPYENLVVATGARCIRPPWYRPLAGVHELRTLADAESLRATLARAKSIVIVGAGFIGTEVAATARAMGLEVTMVMRESAPLVTVLGAEVAGAIKALHEGHGVDVRPLSDVSALLGDRTVEGVLLGDGTTIAAEAVLVAVGVAPRTDWLQGTDLYDRKGVATDRHGRAGPHVWAAGDVVQGTKGHWSTAVAHAKTVALDIVGKTPPLAPTTVPDYFWSDQYSHKLQVLGHPDPEAAFSHVSGSLAAMDFVGVYGSEDRITGALLLDRSRSLGRMRQLVGVGASLDACREKVG